MARPRKPTVRKKLEGTLRPDRMNLAEPEIVATEPTPPDAITAGAMTHWRDLAPKLSGQRILAETDRHILRILCEVLAQYDECEEILAEEGRFYDSGSGVKREHPASKKQGELMKEIRAYSSRLGLSPADRAKVEALPDADEVDPLEQLMGERAN